MRRAVFVLLFGFLLVIVAGLASDVCLAFLDDDQVAQPADGVVAYQGARIHTASGPVIERGMLIVHKGKILDVGSRKDVADPAGRQGPRHDGQGDHSRPGRYPFAHRHLWPARRSARADGNEMTGPVQPGLRALDAINPHDPGIQMALAGGVTTANIMPGCGNAIGGQTLYVKLRGAVVEAMRILGGVVLGGIKFANGENPKGAYGSKRQAPGTRMKVAALQREMLIKAQAYKRQWDTYHKDVADGKKATPPERDLNLDPLMEVLERKRTVHFHCHRADDIMTAVRLSKEFGFELVLQHCTEGYRIADELAKRGIFVSLTLIDSPGGKPEVMGLLEENAAILTKAGVKVAINTDDFITESRFFLRTGAIAVRGGLSGGRRSQGPDFARGPDAAPGGSLRLARKGQGRRFRGPVRGPVQRLHPGAGNIHRRRQGVRPRPCTRIGRTRPAASRWRRTRPTAAEAAARRSKPLPAVKPPAMPARRSPAFEAARRSWPCSPGASTPSARGPSIDGVILHRRRQDHARSATCGLQIACRRLPVRHRRRGDAGADRRPCGGRRCPGASTSRRPTRTRTR